MLDKVVNIFKVLKCIDLKDNSLSGVDFFTKTGINFGVAWRSEVNLLGQVVDWIKKYRMGTVDFIDAGWFGQNCMPMSVNIGGSFTKLDLLKALEIYV